jgi:hypothetical protein
MKCITSTPERYGPQPRPLSITPVSNRDTLQEVFIESKVLLPINYTLFRIKNPLRIIPEPSKNGLTGYSKLISILMMNFHNEITSLMLKVNMIDFNTSKY